MPEPSISQRNNTSEPVSHMQISSQQHHTFENDQKSEHSKSSKPAADNPVVVDDQEKLLQTSQPHVKDVQFKSQNGSARSCTK
ncbi:auxin response factor 2-like, partial [Trifolium medium]|nr:auxin response factor 2-like [Trifolium medium]